MKIKIFVTGGTIDNIEYDSLKKERKNYKTYIPELLKQSRVKVDYGIEILMLKDSKFITEKDRSTIFKKCLYCKQNRILITHGTATMALTAKFLGKYNIKKTIVLVGSAIPSNKKKSDALFNLGAALIAVQILPKGIYIIMNGNVFSWKNVKKNFNTGFF